MPCQARLGRERDHERFDEAERIPDELLHASPLMSFRRSESTDELLHASVSMRALAAEHVEREYVDEHLGKRPIASSVMRGTCKEPPMASTHLSAFNSRPPKG